MFELMDACNHNSAVIRVIGVGGGGGNAVEHMLATSIDGVEFICVNTDVQALTHSSSRTLLQIGTGVTQGLGAGSDPEMGRQAALEDRDRIVDMLKGADMVFVTAGMGGGTGTGASPVIAQLAKEMGILTVAVVTKPFPFELQRRMKIAEDGITELSEHVDSLITIPNEKLLSVLPREVTMRDALRAADEVLHGAVQGIAELITRPGMINVDFADVRTVMSEKGRAMMGSGHARGENRAEEAAHGAINCPLLEDVDLRGACGVLINVAAGADLGLEEFRTIGEVIGGFASESALVIAGTALDETIDDEIRVTVVATGLGEKRPEVQYEVRPVATPPDDGESAVTRDYGHYERPTVIRNQPQARSASAAVAFQEVDADYLDIPAFLRQQAD